MNETHWPWRWIACSTHLTAHASGTRGTDTLSSGFLCFRIWHWLAIVELVNCDILQMYKFNVVKHCSNTESRVKPIFSFFAMLEVNDLLLLNCELSQIYVLRQLITEHLTFSGHHCWHERLLKVTNKGSLHLQHLAFNKLGSLAPPVATAQLWIKLRLSFLGEENLTSILVAAYKTVLRLSCAVTCCNVDRT